MADIPVTSEPGAEPGTTVSVSLAGDRFESWQELLHLLNSAFAYQREGIDPPSSLDSMNADSLQEKASEEALVLASTSAGNGDLLGCVFVRVNGDAAYLGKLAVAPGHQSSGIGRRLVAAAERAAQISGYSSIELDTRVELVENHATFEKLGFEIVDRLSHEGYHRTTFVRMRKELSDSDLVERLMPKDFSGIRQLLAQCGLDDQDLAPDAATDFVGIKLGTSLVATGCVTPFGRVGLLRSIATSGRVRNKGLAGKLVDTLETHARTQSIDALYLLTDSAEQFFLKQGYSEVTRSSAPMEIQHTAQFSSLCPDSAILMMKRLDKRV